MPWDRYVIPTRLKLTDYQLFSSSTTYTLPATHKFAIAEVICAGGGGTNGYSLYTAATGGKFPKPASYAAQGGFGGGGGRFSRFWFPTDNSLTIVLTVGAGGAGTASQSGNFGGQTKLSFYDTVTTKTTTYILPGGTAATAGSFGAQSNPQFSNNVSNLLINQGGTPSTTAVPGEKSHFGGGAGGTGFIYGASNASAGGSSENTRTAAAGNETDSAYLTGGGGAGAGASAAAGSNGSLAGSGGGGGGDGTGGTTGFAGGNGVYPGGGGGGGGPRSYANDGVTYYPTAAGGTGGGAQIKLWIYG